MHDFLIILNEEYFYILTFQAGLSNFQTRISDLNS